MAESVACLAGQRQGNRIDIGQARQQRNQVDAGVAQPAPCAFDQQKNQHEQGGKAQGRAQLERVLQQGFGIVIGGSRGAQVVEERADRVDGTSTRQRQRQTGQQPRIDQPHLQQHARKHQRRGCQQAGRQSGAQLRCIKPGQRDGHGGGGDDTAKQGGHQQAMTSPEDADRDVCGEADTGDQHDHHPGRVGIERLPGAVALIGQRRQQDDGDEQHLQCAAQLGLAEPLECLVQARLEAEQQGHDDRTGRCQLTAFRHGQTAEDESQQQGDLGSHAVIAAAPGIDHVAGDHQQRQHAEHGDPGDCA